MSKDENEVNGTVTALSGCVEAPKLGFLFTKLTKSERMGGGDCLSDVETLKYVRKRYVEGDSPQVEIIDNFTEIINYLEDLGTTAELAYNMRIRQVKSMLGKCWKVAFLNGNCRDDNFYFKPIRMHNDTMVVGLYSPIYPHYKCNSVGEITKSPLCEISQFFLEWGCETPDGIFFTECDESEMIENAKRMVDIVMEEEKVMSEDIPNALSITQASNSTLKINPR